MATPCSNNPDEVISKVIEAKVNADKFNKFVNGTVSETVQLGTGASTPTIRGVVDSILGFRQNLEDSVTDIEGTNVSARSVMSAGGNTLRTLASRFSDIINVKDYGAKGDGSTDDTDAIASALAAATVAGGGRVYMPTGTYIVSHMIDIPSRVSLFGAGIDATVIQASASMPRWTTILNAGSPSALKSGIEIRDLTVDGKNAERLSNADGTEGIDWVQGIPNTLRGSNVMVCYCEDVKIVRVHSKDPSLHCIDVTGASYYGIGTSSSEGDSITVSPKPSRFVYIDECIAEGGFDDNITTHQCSDIFITNCISKNSKGNEVPENSNAYEIDDGSRNVLLSNCIASGCVYGIQVKAHKKQASPWNVLISNVTIWNCAMGLTARHSSIREEGGAENVYEAAEIDLTDSAGDAVNIYGQSPTGRGLVVENLSIYAPKNFVAYNGTVTYASSAININQYSDVLMNNIFISEGYYSSGSEYQKADSLESSIIGISYKAENISISNLQIVGFKSLRAGLSASAYSDPYELAAVYLGAEIKNISLRNVTIRESRPYGVVTNDVDGLILDNINIIAKNSNDNILGIYLGTTEAIDSIGSYHVEGYINALNASNQRSELNIGSARLVVGDKNSPANTNSKTIEMYSYYNNTIYQTSMRNVEGALMLSHYKNNSRTTSMQLTENGVYMAGNFTPSETYPSGVNSAQSVLKTGYSSTTYRSINAGGTINASGADYAEYMVKSDGCGAIAKGQVCGVDAEGKLTDKYSRAHSFVVKSTKPSYVGGDTWADDLGDRPEPPSTDGDNQPTDADFEAYNAALAAYEERLEAVRQTVDRIAFSGVAPCIVSGEFAVGDYVKAVDDGAGGIMAVAVPNPSFEDMRFVVGKIWKIQNDVPSIAVKTV